MFDVHPDLRIYVSVAFWVSVALALAGFAGLVYGVQTIRLSDGRASRNRVRSAPQVSFFTPPRICLNTPFESFLSGPTVFGYEIAQEYPPRVPGSRLAQRLRYSGRI